MFIFSLETYQNWSAVRVIYQDHCMFENEIEKTDNLSFSLVNHHGLCLLQPSRMMFVDIKTLPVNLRGMFNVAACFCYKIPFFQN